MFLYINIREMKPKFVTIREDQNEWLKEHRSINFSGFVQEKLDELMKKEDKK